MNESSERKRSDSKKTSSKKPLVEDITDKLRDLILDNEPGVQIGSLNDIAKQFGVGIVTVQQTARILEHEGLLAVKRGPGGGYYGARPDEAALERAFATYMRVQNFGYLEAFEMLILLDCDIITEAASCHDPALLESVEELIHRIDHCDKAADRIQFEADLREILFKAADRPFFELLARVSMQLYKTQTNAEALFSDEAIIEQWKNGRRRILQAVLQQDQELARFEAERYRRIVLKPLKQSQAIQG